MVNRKRKVLFTYDIVVSCINLASLALFHYSKSLAIFIRSLRRFVALAHVLRKGWNY